MRSKVLSEWPTASSLLACAFGALVLASWALHIRILRTFIPGQVGVMPNTGACFLLLGIALWLENTGPRKPSLSRWAPIVLASIVAALGLISFIEYRLNWDSGIDQLLFKSGPEDLPGSARAGLMSPFAAVSFCLLGPATILLDRRKRWIQVLIQSLAAGAAILSMFGVLDFVLEPTTTHTHISPLTALVLFLLSFGVLFSRSEYGLSALITNPNSGGSLLRHMLPAAITIPTIIAWLRWRGEVAGYYSNWTGLAFMTVASVVLLAVVASWTAAATNRAESTQLKAAESSRWLAAIVNSSDDAILGKTLDGIITSWNPGAEAMYGYSAQEMIGQPIAVIIPPDHRDELQAIMQQVARGEPVRPHENLRRRKDGQTIHVSLSVSPVKDENGKIVGASTIARDISERKRAEEKLCRVNRILRALSECTDALMRIADEPAMLQRVCDVVVGGAGYRMAWVGYAEQDDKQTVRPMASAGFEEGYLNTIDITWADRDLGRGPTGTSIRTAKTAVCGDMVSDPGFAPWREHALRRGFRSSIAIPLKIGADVIGSLTIYDAGVCAFGADEQQLLEQLANNMTYAIMTLRAGAARQKSETNFSALANFVPQLVWMCNPDGMNIYFNQRWVEYTGLTLEQSYGAGWNAPFHPDDKQAAWDAWHYATTAGDTYRAESRLRAADGSYRWFLMRGVPLRDAEGNIVKWFGTCTDIDDLKRAEGEIRQLNSHLEERVQQRTAQLLESERSVRRKLDSILTPEGDLGTLKLADLLDVPGVQSLIEDFQQVVHLPIAIIDPAGEVVAGAGWQDVCTKFHRVHPDACKNCIESDTQLSTGVAPGEFKLYKCRNNLWDVATPITIGGGHVGNLFVGQFFLREEPVDLEVFRAQAAKYGFEKKEYLAALERVPRLSREEVNARMGFLAKLAEVLSQLSYSSIKLARSKQEVTRVNSDLASSVKELEAFTYSVSHDLRAPLRHISGFSKILTEEFGPSLPEEAQHHLHRIQEGTRRMGMLVDDLLNLARVGRRDLSLQVTGFASVVEEVISSLKPDVGDRQIEWQIGSLPYVECDPGLMKQVFQNLLSNAVKFTRPRPQAIIEVAQEEKDGVNAIYVRDNGVGFSMKYADKLFGVFQRLHRTEDFEGTGVGLATVQRIIHKHGGRIWAEAALDKGATFYFTLGNSENNEIKATAVAMGEKA